MTDNSFNEEAIRQTYNILGHGAETEVRLIDPLMEAGPTSLFVRTEVEFFEVCSKYSGKVQVYTGINERRPGGTKAKDVLKINLIAVDVDSKRPDTKQPATEAELRDAENVARVMVAEFERLGYYPYLAMSGNGWQIWMPIPQMEATPEREAKIQHWQRCVKKKFENSHVTIDNVGDLPRVMKIIGTLSVKGTHTAERPHRLSRWEVVDREVIRSKKLARDIDAIELPKEEPTTTALLVADWELRAAIEKDEKASDLLAGRWKKYGYASRSEAELALVIRLAYYGATREQAQAVMGGCQLGKWQGAGDSYREATFKKASGMAARMRADERNEPGATLNLPDEFDVVAYGELLMRRYTIITFRDNGDMFVYQNGIYTPHGETYLESATQELLTVSGEVKTHLILETIGYVRRATYQDRDGYEAPTNLINLKNGILDIHTGGLLPHSPDMVFFSGLPVDYDPGATCPAIMTFLGQVLEPQDIPIIQEVAGYCLLREYPIAKAGMLLGGGNNGKSTLLSLLYAFLGAENCSSVTLQALSFNRFASADLYHKLANICADIPSKELTNTGIFKMLTGGDRISAERKGRDPFSYLNYGKLIFSCNGLPEADDDTDAFYRRWIIINFPRSFDDGSEERKDKLLARLTTPQELSGFLNWALVGLKRLLDNGGFSNSQTTAEIRTEYVKKSNPVRAFVMECVEHDLDAEVSKKEAYDTYSRYCEIRHLPKLNLEAFSKKIYSEVEGIREKRTNPSDGVRVRVWVGMRVVQPLVQAKSATLDLTLDQTSKRDQLPRGYVQGAQGVQAKTYPPSGGHTISRENIGEEEAYRAGVEKNLDSLDLGTSPGPSPGPGNPPQKERNISVLNALKKLTVEYGWGALGELSQATKLSDEIVTVALEQLTKDGHVYSPEAGKWRAT